MIPPPVITRRIAILALCFASTGSLGAAGLGSFGAGYSSGGLGASRGVGGDAGAGGAGGGGELGIGNFSRFPFRVTVALQTGYDDNVFTSDLVAKGSAFTNGSLGVSYEFGSPRTQIEIRAGGGITYYWDRPEQPGPDYNGFLGVTLKHRFTARLSLEISSYSTYQTEPDFSLDLGINRRAGSYFYTSDHVGLTYLWTPRFSTVTSYVFGTLLYGNSTPGSLTNRVENTFGNAFRYLILPTTTLVGEYRIEFVTYLDSDFDSHTHFFLAGLDHTFNPRLNATLRGGVQFRESETTGFQTQNSGEASPYAESVVTYVFGPNSDISWTNRYGIEEADVGTSQGRTTYRTGVNVKYAVTPRITTRLAFYYEHNSFGTTGATSSFEEDALDATLSARYALSRYLGVQLSYSHTEVSSDATSAAALQRGYSRNRIYGGIDLVF